MSKKYSNSKLNCCCLGLYPVVVALLPSLSAVSAKVVVKMERDNVFIF